MGVLGGFGGRMTSAMVDEDGAGVKRMLRELCGPWLEVDMPSA